MSDALEVGRKLVDLCKQNKNREAVETLYADDVESVEPCTMPNMPNPMKGKDTVLGKTDWWFDNHEVHGGEVKGPWPHGDKFIVVFAMDITHKPSGNRMQIEEAGLYTVKNGKVVREEFFYAMPDGGPECD